MFGILGSIFSFFAWVKGVALAGIVGAAIGAGAALLGRLFPSIGTLVISAALGAVVMVGAFNSGIVHTAQQDRIAQLEAEKAKLEHDFKATQEAYDKEQELATAREADLAKQQVVLDEIEKTIATHADADCKTGAFKDELDAIRKLK